MRTLYELFHNNFFKRSEFLNYTQTNTISLNNKNNNEVGKKKFKKKIIILLIIKTIYEVPVVDVIIIIRKNKIK